MDMDIIIKTQYLLNISLLCLVIMLNIICVFLVIILFKYIFNKKK